MKGLVITMLEMILGFFCYDVVNCYTDVSRTACRGIGSKIRRNKKAIRKGFHNRAYGYETWTIRPW